MQQLQDLKPPASMRILLMSRGMAQYRLKLTESLADAIGNTFQLIASPSPWNTNLWEVDWEMLKERTGSLLFREVERVSFRELVSALLQRIRKQKKRGALGAKKLSVSTILPDLIIIHEYSPYMIGLALYAWLAGVPCGVFTELGDGSAQSGIKWHTVILHRIASWLTDFQIANTLAATKPYGFKNRPIFFLPYGVDTVEFSAKSVYGHSDPVTILMVGQYIPRKGADLLLAALKIVKEKIGPKFHLRLIGNKSEDWIRDVSRKSGLEEHVEVVGIRQGDELAKEYHDADLFVLPCRFDTFGVVVAEAASCGLPLLASKHAGSADVYVREGENGWKIDPENSKEMAELLIKLIQQPTLREEFGRRSRKVAEDYCIKNQSRALGEWLKKTVLMP